MATTITREMIDEITKNDWTIGPDGACNTSDKYNELVEAVDRCIRDSGSVLIAGGHHAVAGLIVAQLAHKHGMRPAGV